MSIKITNEFQPKFDTICKSAISYVRKARARFLRAVNHEQIIAYKNRIHHEARDEFQSIEFKGNLSWTHYRMLMSEAREGVRKFYEIEADKNHWSTTELERQMTSFLYERLASSKDEMGVMNLANKGHIIESPEDALKSPVILDFLGYKEHYHYTETNLEAAIIDHMQDFLLEMGRGFTFVSRQKRITVDGDYYRPDLVFYRMLS
ncbi:MAG: YhcG family protein [Coxiellaceae bacterium]|nr:YhcG family protein [Coxiellaceae bacterium]